MNSEAPTAPTEEALPTTKQMGGLKHLARYCESQSLISQSCLRVPMQKHGVTYIENLNLPAFTDCVDLLLSRIRDELLVPTWFTAEAAEEEEHDAKLDEIDEDEDEEDDDPHYDLREQVRANLKFIHARRAASKAKMMDLVYSVARDGISTASVTALEELKQRTDSIIREAITH